EGRPYLDGIEYTVIRNLSTAILAFVAGKFDMTFGYGVTAPLLKDVTSQMPEAICELAPIGVNRSLITNRDKPPFDNPDLRRAMGLSFDRTAFIDTTNWLPKVMRKDFVIGFSPVGGGPDPDQNLYLNYACGGELNYNGYCNPEVDRLIDQQSIEANQEKRKQLVWEIERKLAEDG